MFTSTKTIFPILHPPHQRRALQPPLQLPIPQRRRNGNQPLYDRPSKSKLRACLMLSSFPTMPIRFSGMLLHTTEASAGATRGLIRGFRCPATISLIRLVQFPAFDLAATFVDGCGRRCSDASLREAAVCCCPSSHEVFLFRKERTTSIFDNLSVSRPKLVEFLASTSDRVDRHNE